MNYIHIHKQSPWEANDKRRLIDGNVGYVISHHQHPNHLVIAGGTSLDRLQRVLGTEDFQHHLISDARDPNLPFPVYYHTVALR